MTIILDLNYKTKLIKFYFLRINRIDSYKDHINKIHKICIDLINQYQQNNTKQQSSNLSFFIFENNVKIKNYVNFLL